MASSYFTEADTARGDDWETSVLSPLSASTTAPRSNALQSRVTNVLSASYADLEIRDALAVLDNRRIKNTAQTRRTLRLDIQQELISCNGEIVRDFGQVATQLKRVGAAIEQLKNSCAQMRRQIDAANRETRPMIDEARTALTEKRHVQTKQQLLDAFKAHFVVSDAELMVLTSTTTPVNDDFFAVLTRVKKIHQDCQILLGSENQRLGLEILEHSSRQLNAAYQKLYRWVQREFRTLDLENPQINFKIRRALRTLAERPALFQNCLDFFGEARENSLSSNFQAALTGTPADSDHPVMGKAIELSAHDPLRYVSDMLAWAHSATVSEKEALESLFIDDGEEIAKNIKAGIENEPWIRTDDSDEAADFNGKAALSQLVDRDLTGVFRLVKQRTEQVVHSHEDAVLAYKISSLVTFYCNLFSSLLGEQSGLLETLQPLAETAMRSFRSMMRDHVASLQADLSVIPDDFAVPEFLAEALSSLRVLMKSYDTSIVSNDRGQLVEGFQPILQEALDPFLAGCENITRGMKSPGNHIFALNCLLATNDVLKQYSFSDRSEELRSRIDEHTKGLIEATHRWFSEKSGLERLEKRVVTTDDLSGSYEDPSWLAGVARQLDTFLLSATDEARDFLSQLTDRGLAAKVIEHAAEQFCDDFEAIEMLILDSDKIRARISNGEYEEDVVLRDVFPRTSHEIRVLLS